DRDRPPPELRRRAVRPGREDADPVGPEEARVLGREARVVEDAVSRRAALVELEPLESPQRGVVEPESIEEVGGAGCGRGATRPALDEGLEVAHRDAELSPQRRIAAGAAGLVVDRRRAGMGPLQGALLPPPEVPEAEAQPDGQDRRAAQGQGEPPPPSFARGAGLRPGPAEPPAAGAPRGPAPQS